MRHDNNFDALRLFAASLVLVSHQFALTGHVEPTVDGTTLGGLGVAIFFSISGYLVARSWSRTDDLLTFAKTRLTRVWPGCAVVTLLAAFVLGPLVSTQRDGYFTSPETLRYLRTLAFDIQYRLPGVFAANPYPYAVNGSLWTIPLELTWYAILAAVGLLGLLRRPWTVAVPCALVVAYVLQQRYTGKVGPIKPLLEFGAFFAIGAALSTVRADLLAHRGPILATVGVLAGLVAGAGFFYAAQCMLLPALAIIAGEARTPVVRRVGRFGDVSYGFYLYAFPTQQTIVWLTGNAWSIPVGTVASAAVTLVLAYASWRLVESPAMRWKRSTRAGVPAAA